MSLIRTEEKGSVNLLFSIGHQINSESMILPFILVLALFDFDNVLLWTHEISLVSHKIWFCDAIDIFYYLNTRLFLLFFYFYCLLPPSTQPQRKNSNSKMATLAKLLSSICVCVIVMLTTKAVEATPTYTATHCTNTTTYAPNSTFQTNLDILLYYFSNNISQSNGYFLGITGFNSVNAVGGLFLCRGDVATTVCNQCLTTAIKEIRQHCPNQTEALIWYDECLVHYTNRYFAVDKIDPRVNLNDGNIVSSVDLGRFNQSLHGLLNDLATEASGSSESKKFAAGEVVVTESMTVYGLMQCTNDLTNSECGTCLKNAIGTIPNGKQGARALLPSCNVRYQLYPFFTSSSPSSSGNKLFFA